MGACNIDFEIKGKASRSEIEKRFEKQLISDKAHNGHQDGYSGDFQTVDRIDFSHLGETFNDYKAAYDYCLDKAEKWVTVIAVYYRNAKGETNTLIAGWGAC